MRHELLDEADPYGRSASIVSPLVASRRAQAGPICAGRSEDAEARHQAHRRLLEGERRCSEAIAMSHASVSSVPPP